MHYTQPCFPPRVIINFPTGTKPENTFRNRSVNSSLPVAKGSKWGPSRHKGWWMARSSDVAEEAGAGPGAILLLTCRLASFPHLLTGSSTLNQKKNLNIRCQNILATLLPFLLRNLFLPLFAPALSSAACAWLSSRGRKPLDAALMPPRSVLCPFLPITAAANAAETGSAGKAGGYFNS